MLQEKKLECILNKPKAIQFMGDGDKLARAFGNLLKNAINYSYLNTTIKIDIKEYEDKIEIVFKNKGDKIPEYKLEKIFDKFYRADESRTSSTGGAGLGLAITKQIIELHNGKIYAKNDNEFIEFYIELSKWGKNEKEKIKEFIIKNWKWILISLLSVLICFIGISRIYLGVHYTSDVLGGFLISVSYLVIYISAVNNVFYRNEAK